MWEGGWDTVSVRGRMGHGECVVGRVGHGECVGGRVGHGKCEREGGTR